MTGGRFTLIEACAKAAEAVSQSNEMDRLYRRAVRCLGEGELRMRVLEAATEAVEDNELREEVFASNESKLSFLCGVWIQFLLVEFAGIGKERLRSLAQKVFTDLNREQSLH